MDRDAQLRLGLPIALAICLGLAPARAQAPAAAESHANMAAATPKDPFASDDITGAIPTARETTLPDGGAQAIPAQNAAPDAAPPGAPSATTPQPKSNVSAPAANALPSVAPKPLTGFAAAIKTALDSWPPPQGKGRQAAELWLEHKDITAYYAARDYAPLWISAGKPVAAVANIKTRLALAGDDGLSLPGFRRRIFPATTTISPRRKSPFRKKSSPMAGRPAACASIRRTSIR